jgi:hypothetical protein
LLQSAESLPRRRGTIALARRQSSGKQESARSRGTAIRLINLTRHEVRMEFNDSAACAACADSTGRIGYDEIAVENR